MPRYHLSHLPHQELYLLFPICTRLQAGGRGMLLLPGSARHKVVSDHGQHKRRYLSTVCSPLYTIEYTKSIFALTSPLGNSMNLSIHIPVRRVAFFESHPQT